MRTFLLNMPKVATVEGEYHSQWEHMELVRSSKPCFLACITYAQHSLLMTQHCKRGFDSQGLGNSPSPQHALPPHRLPPAKADLAEALAPPAGQSQTQTRPAQGFSEGIPGYTLI